ncbi:MAG: hypothetical protein ACP5NX_00120 [Candidatus Bilamarchaeaceae archaeon]
MLPIPYDPLYPYAAALLAGFLIKAVDYIEDDLPKLKPKMGKFFWVKFPIAILAGLLLLYAIVFGTFAPLFIAILFAAVFARKVDTHAHMLAFGIAALSLILTPISGQDIAYFIMFMVLAFIDELELFGALRPISDYRLVLKAGVLPFGLFLGRWDFVIALYVFDIGYLVSQKLMRMLFNRRTI